DPHRGAQGKGPLRRRSEGRGRPVEGADVRAHFAASLKEGGLILRFSLEGHSEFLPRPMGTVLRIPFLAPPPKAPHIPPTRKQWASMDLPERHAETPKASPGTMRHAPDPD